MIEIALNQVTINFGFKQVLGGISFDVQTGEKVALVGRNGCGKTTIFKIITGQEKMDGGSFTVRKGATIGFLQQIPKSSEDDLTVSEILKKSQQDVFDIENRMREVETEMGNLTDEKDLNKLMSEYNRLQNQFTSLGGYETEENFNKICTVFKLNEMLLKKHGELSGGQKTIVNMAKILLQKPDILLLDEPTNHIDIAALTWLEGFIASYRGTVIIISHDRYFIDRTATKTILVDRGTCDVFGGNYSFSLKEQERILMEEFENYKTQQRKIEAMKESMKRFKEWGERGDNPSFFVKYHQLEKRLEKMEMLEKPKLEKDKIPLNFQMNERSGKKVYAIDKLCFGFDDKNLLNNISVELYYKEKICILGKNGCGKTTFVNILLENIKDFTGKVEKGSNVKIGYIEQEISFGNENESVLNIFKDAVKVTELEARRVLAKFFFFGDDVYKRAETLSGGEKVILKLAILLQEKINFLILDEPTNHLDIVTKELLEESLGSYKGTLLFISHDRFFINKVADRIIEIEDGHMKNYFGDYDEYQRQKKMVVKRK